MGVSGRNSAPSLMSVGGIVPYHWCKWEEWCSIIDVSGRNSALSSLVSVGGMVLHHWYQWKEQCPIIGVSGRSNFPSFVSVVGI
ncbi:unnamed protein product, partial [Staurois parvus]